ncbi:MAG: preprotein translocase subunit SecG [Candidatus Margulisbacteria bacterium]|nr:preprotein translocase subunit SecG [Candidatus Margulisiibacteriota bacterium]
MLKILLLIIEFISAILLIGAVLLHSPKGTGLGGVGGQAHMFSSNGGMEAGLNRFTTIVAAVFLVSAVILSLLF